MAKDQRFILEPYLSGGRNRYTCPACGKKKEFSRYIDSEGEISFSDDVGRCNHERSCGYHYTPSQYFQDNPKVKALLVQEKYKPSCTSTFTQYGQASVYKGFKHNTSASRSTNTSASNRTNAGKSINQKAKNHTIPKRKWEKSVVNPKCYPNYFIQWLAQAFGTSIAQELQQLYGIGTAKKWQGATVFWQRDYEGEVRTGKVMLYNPSTGKRVKKPYNHITWAHSLLKPDNFELKQCFFGEYLLRQYPRLPVSVVESEATAITMAALVKAKFLPPSVWIATGGSNGRRWREHEVYCVLAGRKVVLYPDLGFYEKWEERAQLLRMENIDVEVSTLLEEKAPAKHKEEGNYDLRDYFIQDHLHPKFNCYISEKGYPLSWDID